MRCVAIVSTQLQLLNFVEYVAENDISENTVILCASSKNRMNQLNLLTTHPYVSKWVKRAIKIYIEGKGLYFYINTIFNKIKLDLVFSKNSFDICIIGNYHNITHRYIFLISTLKNPSVCLVHLDDGLAILDCNQQRKKELTNGIPSLQGSRSELYLYSSKIRTFIPSKIVFFTSYNIIISDNDTVISNTYKYLKDQIHSIDMDEKLESADIIILGQPLVNLKLLNQAEYTQIFVDAIDTINIEKPVIYYLPHPTELIQESLTPSFINIIKIVKTDLPFELICMTIRSNAYVIGYYTSALSCIKLLKINCYAISLFPENSFRYNNTITKKIIKNAYQQLDELGISIIQTS